jgi:hypothetical protein
VQLIYYFIYIGLSLLSFLEVFSRNKGFKRLIVSLAPYVIFLLILFSGTRFFVGYDYEAYVDIYNGYAYDNEIGFEILVYLLHMFGSGSGGLFFVVALLSVAIKSYSISKLSPYFFLSLCLYFSQDFLARDFGNMRQGLAISFSFFSFLLYIKNKNLLSIAFAVLSFLFHYSAFVYILWLLYDRIRFGNVSMVFWLVVALIAGQVMDASSVNYLLAYVHNDYIFKKISDYSARPEYSSSLGITPGLVVRIFIFMVLVYYERVFKYRVLFYECLKSATFFGLFVFLIFNSFEIIAVRLSLYFRILDVVTLSIILAMVRDKYQRLLIYCFIVLYAFQGLYRELTRHGVYFAYDSWLF